MAEAYQNIATFVYDDTDPAQNKVLYCVLYHVIYYAYKSALCL